MKTLFGSIYYFGSSHWEDSIETAPQSQMLASQPRNGILQISRPVRSLALADMLRNYNNRDTRSFRIEVLYLSCAARKYTTEIKALESTTRSAMRGNSRGGDEAWKEKHLDVDIESVVVKRQLSKIVCNKASVSLEGGCA